MSVEEGRVIVRDLFQVEGHWMASAAGQVRQALETSGKPCRMEEVVALCPDLSWNQIFQALCHLSRAGHVRLSLDGRRGFRASMVRPTI